MEKQGHMISNSMNNILQTVKLLSVEPYLFLVYIGTMVRLVTFQSLLMESACRNTLVYSEDICKNLDAHPDEKSAAMEAGNNLYMGVMLMSSLPAVVVAIFLGPWSDKYSRRYPMIISASGMALENIIGSILVLFPKISPLWYVAAALFSGFSGGFIMSTSGAFSYLSDVTEERSRPTRYAVLEFSNIAAIVTGTVLGGKVFEVAGYLPIMIMAPCSFIAAVLYVFVAVKETVQKDSGVKCSQMFRDLIQLDNIKQSFKTCSRKRPGNIRLQIWLLVWISCSQRFVDMGTLAVSFPFARKMYSWGVPEFSDASTAYYVVNAFVTISLVPILSKMLRLHEAAIGLIGVLSLIAKMVITSVAFKEGFFYYAWMTGTLNNLIGISIRSRIPKLVNKDELGRAFSLLGTCESITPILGTVCFVQMYNASLYFFPGLPFAASALLLMPSVFIFNWMMKMPTVSFGEYGREPENEKATPMKNISSSYAKLEEEVS